MLFLSPRALFDLMMIKRHILICLPRPINFKQHSWFTMVKKFRETELWTCFLLFTLYHKKIFGSGKVRLYWLEPPFALVGVGMNTEFIVVRISRLVPWKRPVRRHIRQQRRRRLVVLRRTLAANGAPAQPAGHKKQDNYQCTVSWYSSKWRSLKEVFTKFKAPAFVWICPIIEPTSNCW